MTTPFSSYGTLDETLPHLSRLVLDNGEFLSAREMRAYLVQLQQEAEEQAKLLQRFADAAHAFDHADELAQGFGRPQYDRAREKLAAAEDAWRTWQQRRSRNRTTS